MLSIATARFIARVVRPVPVALDGVGPDPCQRRLVPLEGRGRERKAEPPGGVWDARDQAVDHLGDARHEWLADQADAIYCRGVIGGGSVGREFVLRPAYGVRIRDGRPTGEVLRRFDLVGDKLATLARLAGIADDLTFFDSALGCDKDGQNNLPVSQGAPHLALSAASLRPIARP